MIATLYRLYWALERMIVPGLTSSQNVYARTVVSHVRPQTRWLDLGCGHQLFPEWASHRGQEDLSRTPSLIVGMDPDICSVKQHKTISNRVVGLGMPFRERSFDLITANMVFEHIEDPLGVLQEVRRALTPGGICIIHTTNLLYWKIRIARVVPQSAKSRLVEWMEQRRQEDVYPTYYRINTDRAIRDLASRAGLDVEQMLLINTSSAGRILLGPLVLVELLWIRLLQRSHLRRYRSNIIAVLQRPGQTTGIEAIPHTTAQPDAEGS